MASRRDYSSNRFSVEGREEGRGGELFAAALLVSFSCSFSVLPVYLLFGRINVSSINCTSTPGFGIGLVAILGDLAALLTGKQCRRFVASTTYRWIPLLAKKLLLIPVILI